MTKTFVFDVDSIGERGGARGHGHKEWRLSKLMLGIVFEFEYYMKNHESNLNKKLIVPSRSC